MASPMHLLPTYDTYEAPLGVSLQRDRYWSVIERELRLKDWTYVVHYLEDRGILAKEGVSINDRAQWSDGRVSLPEFSDSGGWNPLREKIGTKGRPIIATYNKQNIWLEEVYPREQSLVYGQHEDWVNNVLHMVKGGIDWEDKYKLRDLDAVAVIALVSRIFCETPRRLGKQYVRLSAHGRANI